MKLVFTSYGVPPMRHHIFQRLMIPSITALLALAAGACSVFQKPRSPKQWEVEREFVVRMAPDTVAMHLRRWLVTNQFIVVHESDGMISATAINIDQLQGVDVVGLNRVYTTPIADCGLEPGQATHGGQMALMYAQSVPGSSFATRVEVYFTPGVNRSEFTNLDPEMHNMSYEVTTCVSTGALERRLREYFERL